MFDVEVITDPDAAVAALDPLRSRILGLLAEPGSATTLAAALGMGRQQINYHLRTLEAHGLVQLVEERPRRGLTERVMTASARSYVLAPAGQVGRDADPSRTDQMSSRYLIALAARMVREVADLARRADDAGKPLATLSIDSEIRFASVADRATFTAELTNAVAALIAKFHDERAPAGRRHRLVVAAHPFPPARRREVVSSDTHPVATHPIATRPQTPEVESTNDR